MSEKFRFAGMPQERHDTAAWANCNALSDANLANEIHLEDAKDWVDTNQK